MTSLRRTALVVALLCAALGCAPAVAGATVPRWLPPLAGPLHVLRGFDPPAHRWLAGHRGVDLAGRAGMAVRAAGGGVVRFAGPVAGVLVVGVRHPGGLETTYEPVRPSVRRGQPVRAGQLLGQLVLPGGHCRPAACLHWGLRRGEAYLDPLGLLGRAAVRLLPLGRTPPQWAAPLTGGAAAGSVLTWAALAGRAARRRRRPPPRGVTSLAAARRRRSHRLGPGHDEIGVPHERRGKGRHRQPQQARGRPP